MICDWSFALLLYTDAQPKTHLNLSFISFVSGNILLRNAGGMKTVLGVDLGTQSIKVILYDPVSKCVLQTATSALTLISHEDGTREQNPHQWVSGLFDCISQFPAHERRSVAAIGISGQQHGFVPVDEHGDVLAPAKLWCDTSTVEECDEIVATVGKEACVKSVGCITTGFTAPKVRWMKKHRPDIYTRLRTILLPHDYLNFVLTGEGVMECGDASGTGMLHISTRTWSKQILRAIDPDRDLSLCLPRLIQAHEPVGVILESVASKLGLSPSAIVSAGGGDNMMSAIGTGNVTEGRLTASMGTSGTLFGFSDKPVIDATGFLAAFCSSTGGWLPLICTMNCTVATEQMRELFSLHVDEIEPMVAPVAPGCDGLLTLPFYNGERAPDLPNGRAVIFGLDGRNTSQGHLMRSAMEAAVFALKAGLLAFEKHGMRFEEVTVTGGGSASAAWRQICADVLNLRVRVLKQKENAALGGALQALWCYQLHMGGAATLEDIVTEHLDEDCEKACVPDEKRVKVYEEVYVRYVELLDTLTPMFKKKPA